MRMSVSASLESRLLEIVRSLLPDMTAVGFLETADEGTAKQEDLTAVQVRVHNLTQTTENSPFFSVQAEIRLNVEQAEDAGGRAFFYAHEKLALWLEDLILRGDAGEALETDCVFVDGIQRTGDEKDFDTSVDVWFTVWNVTVTGRIKKEA